MSTVCTEYRLNQGDYGIPLAPQSFFWGGDVTIETKQLTHAMHEILYVCRYVLTGASQQTTSRGAHNASIEMVL